MEEGKFKIRSYGWQELALLYGEGLTPESSTKRLSKWVQVNPSLTDELERCGWKKGKKDSDTHTGAGYRPFSGRTVNEKTDSYA